MRASPLADIFPANGFAMRGKRAWACGEMSEELDLRGLKCPLPALMTRKKLSTMRASETLEVLASDPLSAVDIPHMCHQEGHALLESGQADNHHRFLIRRG